MWINRLFGQESNSTTVIDHDTPHARERALWRQVGDGSLLCPCCQTPVRDLLSLAFPAPGIWARECLKAPNQEFFRTKEDILTDDFCRCEGHLFVRAVMEFPLPDYDHAMMVGVWGTLSEENFTDFTAHFENGTQDRLPLMFSWLSNPVPPGAKVPEPCALQPLGNHLRPRMMFADNESPLYCAQIDGMSYDELRRFLAKFGHQIPQDGLS